MPGRQGRSAASAGHPVRAARRAPDAVRLRTTSARRGRDLRLPVFIGTGTLLGVVAHTAATRALPDPILVVAAALVVAACGAALRRTERSFETIATALLSAQTAVHGVLALGHLRPSPGYLGHLYPGHAMLVAHVLAAGVAAWWLRHGEAAVWAASGWCWPAPPAPAGSRPVVRTRCLPVPAAPRRGASRDDAALRPPRRGPPRTTTAVLTG